MTDPCGTSEVRCLNILMFHWFWHFAINSKTTGWVKNLKTPYLIGHCSPSTRAIILETVFHCQYVQSGSVIHPALFGHSFPRISEIFSRNLFPKPAKTSENDKQNFHGFPSEHQRHLHVLRYYVLVRDKAEMQEILRKILSTCWWFRKEAFSRESFIISERSGQFLSG